jgi:hypothetical protein
VSCASSTIRVTEGSVAGRVPQAEMRNVSVFTSVYV